MYNTDEIIPAFVPPVAFWSAQPMQQQQEGEPKPDDKQQENKPEPKDEPLGEGGIKALQAERDARKAAEARVKELQDADDARKKEQMTESERDKADKAEAIAKAEKAEREALRWKLGSIAKLDPTLIDRIKGDTEAEMKADIEELLKLNPTGSKVPKADPSQGRKQSAGGLTPKEQFTDTIEQLFDRPSTS